MQELWGRSPADQANLSLKGHFNPDRDSVREEGKKTNKSVCQDFNKRVESDLCLIALSRNTLSP